MVPPSTIARVFSEVSFSKDNTRITSSAVGLSAEYIRLFVREAVLRANAQRLAEGVPTEIDGIDNVAPYGEILDALDEFGGDEDDVFEHENEHENEHEHEHDDEIEDRGLGVSTQMPPASDSNDALTTRHLAVISGLLVMDF